MSERIQTFNNKGVPKYFSSKKLLGKGAFGQVFLVRDSNGIEVADKIVYKEKIEFNEIDILCKFEHPNIIQAREFYYSDYDDNFHIILPLAKMDLLKFTETNYVLNSSFWTSSSRKLSLNEAVMMMYQILSAVHFLHSQGYFHCDIKSQNILIFENNKPVLSDFGWTYKKEYDTGNICGTTTYASPQCSQVRTFQKEECDHIKSDIYCLGAVFYEIITGNELIMIEDTLEHQNDNYQNVESKLLILEKNTTNDQIKQALQTIYKMCRFSQKERIGSILSVLSEPIFASRGLTTPISGRVKITNVPKDICSNPFCDKEILNILLPWCLLVIMTNFKKKLLGINFLELCIFPGMLIRALQLAKSKYEVQCIGCAVMYITSSIAGKDVLDINEYTVFSDGACSSSITFTWIVDIIKYFSGTLTHPTIYNETDNGLECLWYVLMCLNDCNYIFKDPKELHCEYGFLETKRPELKHYRFSKYQKPICSLTLIENKERVILTTANFKIKISYNKTSFFEIF